MYIRQIKGCDSNFEVKSFKVLKVATIEKNTTCTSIALENCVDNDQPLNMIFDDNFYLGPRDAVF